MARRRIHVSKAAAASVNGDLELLRLDYRAHISCELRRHWIHEGFYVPDDVRRDLTRVTSIISLSYFTALTQDAIVRLERAVYNVAVDNTHVRGGRVNDTIVDSDPVMTCDYASMYTRMLMHLSTDDPCYSDRLRALVEETGDLHDIVCAPADKLPIDGIESVVELIRLRESQEIEIHYNTDYTCKICGNATCTAQPIQLRAADEACDTQVYCHKCRFPWIIKSS
jgi:DNA-directed RNA polymerase subunit M/transcription elongation factor TFIIS